MSILAIVQPQPTIKFFDIKSYTFCMKGSLNNRLFYRTQVSLGSGLWVPASLSNSVQQLCETLLMLLGWWWYQLNTIDDAHLKRSQLQFVINVIYMQVALADGQTKIVGILGVKWNTILITRNTGIQTLPEAQRTQGIESITQIIPNGKSHFD